MFNNYRGIADYYDQIVNSGYYNMPSVAREYKNLIGSDAKKILEIGVGTGELSGLLKDSYQITGIDFSDALLNIAREKLKNTNVELLKKDVRELKFNNIFDAAVGHASIFIVIESKEGIVVESFLTNISDIKISLENICKSIKCGAKFIIDFHPEHTPGKRFMQLPHNNKYEFEIKQIGGTREFYKIHWIKNPSGKIIAESKDHKIRISLEEFNNLSLQSGFSKVEIIGKYLVLIK